MDNFSLNMEFIKETKRDESLVIPVRAVHRPPSDVPTHSLEYEEEQKKIRLFKLKLLANDVNFPFFEAETTTDDQQEIESIDGEEETAQSSGIERQNVDDQNPNAREKHAIMVNFENIPGFSSSERTHLDPEYPDDVQMIEDSQENGIWISHAQMNEELDTEETVVEQGEEEVDERIDHTDLKRIRRRGELCDTSNPSEKLNFAEQPQDGFANDLIHLNLSSESSELGGTRRASKLIEKVEKAPPNRIVKKMGAEKEGEGNMKDAIQPNLSNDSSEHIGTSRRSKRIAAISEKCYKLDEKANDVICANQDSETEESEDSEDSDENDVELNKIVKMERERELRKNKRRCRKQQLIQNVVEKELEAEKMESRQNMNPVAEEQEETQLIENVQENYNFSEYYHDNLADIDEFQPDLPLAPDNSRELAGVESVEMMEMEEEQEKQKSKLENGNEPRREYCLRKTKERETAKKKVSKEGGKLEGLEEVTNKNERKRKTTNESNIQIIPPQDWGNNESRRVYNLRKTKERTMNGKDEEHDNDLADNDEFQPDFQLPPDNSELIEVETEKNEEEESVEENRAQTSSGKKQKIPRRRFKNEEERKERRKETQKLSNIRWRAKLKEKIRQNTLTDEEKERIERRKERLRICCNRYGKRERENRRLNIQTEEAKARYERAREYMNVWQRRARQEMREKIKRNDLTEKDKKTIERNKEIQRKCYRKQCQNMRADKSIYEKARERARINNKKYRDKLRERIRMNLLTDEEKEKVERFKEAQRLDGYRRYHRKKEMRLAEKQKINGSGNVAEGS